MDPLFEFLCRMGDNTLVLGHRLSEWCGKAPVLEEDIALANTALDLIGQTQMWLTYAGEVEGKGRDADRLAYFRDPYDFRCCLLVQQPNGDFGYTMMRQFLFDCYHLCLLDMLATGKGAGAPHRANPSSDQRIAEIAAKAVKEVTYQQERSADLVIRLGDGTEESHIRMQRALDALWPLTRDMAALDQVDHAMAEADVIADPGALASLWEYMARNVLAEATLIPPDVSHFQKGGKTGQMHSEHLGHLLAVMQSLPRSHPNASW
ncbi:1,2-phenylacetyl-CoA epoxidase subunit PaaC [Gymnodinialimonas sp. 2305UL16-5]|uniref:1,2-phenylacetyl-CoA epoxidase subunit PaaC n=1 Tax=Gymnodinialimonas mytili TaxID=3126503 RepID=UPI003098F7F4